MDRIVFTHVIIMIYEGAKKSTGIDFWRMVWQENSNCIVMVANIEEMGRVGLFFKVMK